MANTEHPLNTEHPQGSEALNGRMEEFSKTEEPPKPIRLSPSGAATFRQCQLKWKFKYVHKIKEPSGYPAVLGGFVHSVLEDLMNLEPKERTKDNTKKIARKIYDNQIELDNNFTMLNLDEQQAISFRQEAWNSITGLWDLEDPSQVSVFATEKRIQTKIGNINFFGIVDRIDNEAAGVSIVDYKTGKLPRTDKDRKEKLDQVLLYAAAYQAQENVQPQFVKLYFPSPSNGVSNEADKASEHIISAPVTEDALNDTIKDLEATHCEIQSSIGTDDFKALVGPLCGWCFYVDKCPTGKNYVTKRFNEGSLKPSAPAILQLGLG